jgi:hypothetical protein
VILLAVLQEVGEVLRKPAIVMHALGTYVVHALSRLGDRMASRHPGHDFAFR